MAKWADYLISEVKYGKNHMIEQAKQHTDSGEEISDGTLVERSTISHNIKNGKSYKTIFHSLKGWKSGDDLYLIRVSGDHFIRTDKNNDDRDFFRSIPKF